MNMGVTKAKADKCKLHLKPFSDPKHGHLQESEKVNAETGHLKRKTGVPIRYEKINS